MSRLMPVRDAAIALGISEITLKRRIKAGQVTAEKERMVRGWRYVVEVPDEPLPDRLPPPTAAVEQQLGEIIKLLREQLAEKDRQLETRSREVSELHIIIERLTRQETPLIQPPDTPTEAASVDMSQTPHETHQPEQSKKTPWWRFWT